MALAESEFACAKAASESAQVSEAETKHEDKKIWLKAAVKNEVRTGAVLAAAVVERALVGSAVRMARVGDLPGRDHALNENALILQACTEKTEKKRTYKLRL